MKNMLCLIMGAIGIMTAIWEFSPPHEVAYIVLGILLVLASIASFVVFFHTNNYFRRGMK